MSLPGKDITSPTAGMSGHPVTVGRTTIHVDISREAVLNGYLAIDDLGNTVFADKGDIDKLEAKRKKEGRPADDSPPPLSHVRIHVAGQRNCVISVLNFLGD